MPIPFLNSQSDRYVSLRFSKQCIAAIALSILLQFTAGTSLAQSLCSHQFRALQAETQITNMALNANDFMIRRGLRTYSKISEGLAISLKKVG